MNPITGKPHSSQVLRAYDPPEKRWQAGHRGVDLAAQSGDPIRAASSGIVAFSGVIAGTPVISITHADGFRTTYQPVYSELSAGTEVVEGQFIGVLGSQNITHPGLHWGARLDSDNNGYINPLSLLATPVIRLKPVRS
ncbi:M23 family metallopeptidase [Corynebacterium caspium]|uniref:M23 family metallopeptidase n=1 Tax=Corynebacterium caspium TaxID=234828 RepID=UPI00039B9C24|nr:M23 family metallopeptidase [Corynebacterium caspium]